MLVISSREFRDKQAEYFDRADNGEQIIVQRGKDKAYALTPVSDSDLYCNPQMIEKISKAIEDAKNGNVKKIKTVNDLKNMLIAL